MYVEKFSSSNFRTLSKPWLHALVQCQPMTLGCQSAMRQYTAPSTQIVSRKTLKKLKKLKKKKKKIKCLHTILIYRCVCERNESNSEPLRSSTRIAARFREARRRTCTERCFPAILEVFRTQGRPGPTARLWKASCPPEVLVLASHSKANTDDVQNKPKADDPHVKGTPAFWRHDSLTHNMAMGGWLVGFGPSILYARQMRTSSNSSSTSSFVMLMDV